MVPDLHFLSVTQRPPAWAFPVPGFVAPPLFVFGSLRWPPPRMHKPPDCHDKPT